MERKNVALPFCVRRSSSRTTFGFLHPAPSRFPRGILSAGFVAPPLRFLHERTHFRIRTRIWNFIKKDDELSVSKTEETPDEKSERYFSESPETDGLLFYLWTFYANSNNVFLLNHS